MNYAGNAEGKRQERRKEREDAESSSWGEDQKKREYYYDDAHGYVISSAVRWLSGRVFAGGWLLA